MTEEKKLFEELGKVESARLGFDEEYNIFDFMIIFVFGPSAQGFGGISLDDYVKKFDKRIPTQEGMRLVVDIMLAFDVKEFHQIKGKIAYVIRESERGSIIGIRTPLFETNKTILLSDYFKKR